MEGNQKINCNVMTCKYNNIEQNKCMLDAIQVTPTEDCETKNPDESMCSSYEYEEN